MTYTNQRHHRRFVFTLNLCEIVEDVINNLGSRISRPFVVEGTNYEYTDTDRLFIKEFFSDCVISLCANAMYNLFTLDEDYLLQSGHCASRRECLKEFFEQLSAETMGLEVDAYSDIVVGDLNNVTDKTILDFIDGAQARSILPPDPSNCVLDFISEEVCVALFDSTAELIEAIYYREVAPITLGMEANVDEVLPVGGKNSYIFQVILTLEGSDG